MTVWQFIKFSVFPWFFLSNLFLTFLDTLTLPFVGWFFHFFIRTSPWQFDSCSKTAYLLAIHCQTPILTVVDTLTVDTGIIWEFLKKPRISLLFLPRLTVRNCQTVKAVFFDTCRFDTLTLDTYCFDSLTLWHLTLTALTVWRFDSLTFWHLSLWHFDTWRFDALTVDTLTLLFWRRKQQMRCKNRNSMDIRNPYTKIPCTFCFLVVS